MEPERNIEKNLRAYAQKRRADAGDPLKLHPATRRLLQSEVARRAQQPGKQKTSATLWELFLHRWAFIAGSAAIVFFAAILFLPAFNASQKKVQNTETPASVVASGNVAATPSVSSLSKSKTDRNATTLSDSMMITNSAVRLAVNAPAPAVRALDHPVTEPASAAKDLDMKAGPVQFATAAQNFKNYNASAQNSFKNTLAPAKDVAVLANFQVQQNGNAIRVVDADGSVYDGELRPENEFDKNVLARTDALPARDARDKINTSREESQLTKNSQPAQNYSFWVTGTNLTLKQNVVFAGNLLANSKAVDNRQQEYNRQSGAGVPQLQQTVTNQLPWSNSRIAGTAVVDDTNNIEINAEPQAP